MLVEVAVTATTQAQHVSAYITNYLSTLIKSYLSISYRWTVVVIYLSPWNYCDDYAPCWWVR